MKYCTDNVSLLTCAYVPSYCVEISREEYLNALELKKSAPEGYDYHRIDGVWVLVELPPVPPVEEEATAEDYEAALEVFGV